jgi:carboxypeptidase C (cathepsin A)
MIRTWLRGLCLALVLTTPAMAQERPAEHPAERGPAARPRLPPPAVTQQTLDLPGGALHFSATAASLVLPDAQGAPEAEVATISYLLADSDPRTRPVTFVLNGGPGFASAWLQLGAVGPWRVAMGGPGNDTDGVPSAAPDLLANAETWLPFTDLVFVDPVGTGYSRFVTGDESVRKRLWSVGGDIAALGEAMRRWLEGAGRVASPKYLLGESYGGFRVPRLAQVLNTVQGIGVSGLILVSPELDAGGRSTAYDPLSWAEELPSLAAVARARSGTVTRAGLADVEAYAIGDYLRDQIGSGRDPAALARMAARVAALTGLPEDLVRREGGAVNVGTFLRELVPGRLASVYDATLSNPQAIATNPFFGQMETSLARLSASFTSAMLELYEHHLNWHPDTLYRLFNRDAEREWDWGRGPTGPESISALRLDLAEDPRLHVLVAHGLFDLVTPYFRTALILEHLPDIPPPDRVRLVTFAGGHMFYSRDAARAGLRDAALGLIQGR